MYFLVENLGRTGKTTRKGGYMAISYLNPIRPDVAVAPHPPLRNILKRWGLAVPSSVQAGVG